MKVYICVTKQATIPLAPCISKAVIFLTTLLTIAYFTKIKHKSFEDLVLKFKDILQYTSIFIIN
jgi:hypothetical protein